MPTDEEASGSSRPDVLFWYGSVPDAGASVEIEGEEAKHLLSVVRRRVGEVVWLADGTSSWLRGRLVAAARGRATIAIEARLAAPTAPARPVTLAFPALRPGRTEILLEKCTELGVSRFVPIRFERSRPGSGRADRWARVVRAAAMQCLRPAAPVVSTERSLHEWVGELDAGSVRWVAAPGGAGPYARGAAAAALVVGPEGDLAPAERHLLEEAGFARIGLGATRLRAETAAIALVTALGLTLPGPR